ncbi:hypothetical protein QBC47DRAFT_410959 [Echria macrotheca]|uniref:Uncharacterized protein n=1 Tax=Echria macrotheca TaxID=438768 RepID=A0AAJ0FCD8_9PEZI|nr:hypothetical protein QBC47DRAFT_410959 [Echria macrotheca]
MSSSSVPVPPLLVLLDFDGTITQEDTINALAEEVIAHEGTVSLSEWDGIVKAWLDEYEAHIGVYRPPAAERSTAEAELEFLESLRGVEERSLGRVERAGVFDFGGVGRGGVLRGFGRGALERGVVKVREGVGEFLRGVMEMGGGGDGEVEVGVVSVNWSGEWMRGVLEGVGIEGVVEGDRSLVNWIGKDGRVMGPEGVGGRVLVTAGDKREAARSVVRGWEGEKKLGGGEKGRWIYVGDSVTDLGCLLDATVGVVLAESEESKVVRTLRRVGKEVSHVGGWREMALPALVWARDFREILESGLLELGAE